MRRSRGRDLSLGVAAVLANVLLVLGVVALATGRVGSTDAPTSTTPSGSASSRPASTKPAMPTTTGPAVRPVSELLGSPDDVSVAVLGDGTGDEDGEWVSAFAEEAGATHRVVLRGLDPNDPTQYASRRTFGGTGPTLTVWNGSRSGATADYPAKRLDFLTPEKPDVVLLSFGRDDTVSTVAARLEATFRSVRSRWPDVPVAVVLQAPDRDDRIGPVRAMTRDWAASHQLPVVDVAAAFSAAGDPNSYVSVVDPPSTNARGGRLWGRTVLRALGGSPS